MSKKALTYQAVCTRVAELLRAERCQQGLSLSEVAERAGLSYQMVSYVERGMRVPGLDTFLRITAALRLDAPNTLKTALTKEEKSAVREQRAPSRRKKGKVAG